MAQQGWRTKPDWELVRLGSDRPARTSVALVDYERALLDALFEDGSKVRLSELRGHFARLMPRRTARGTGMLRRVLGFRRFIEESEVERARFAERQQLFSEYLPYAVVFGSTERWARAFAGLEGELPAVGWYVSPHPFTVHGFSDSIEGFSVTTAGTLTAVPAGTGASGFGGGFSGGGDGGGGGGSW